LITQVLTGWSRSRIIVAALALAGVGILLYPWAANWFHDRAHRSAIDGYVGYVQSQPGASVSRQLAEAHRFNSRMPKATLSDAYDNPEGAAGGWAATQYRSVLAGPDGEMGVIAIPRIGVHLPIFHGTSGDVLRRGVGHLYGTSLPVGGPGTHSVLTGHSGIPGDTLFSNLHELATGDTFTITVLDQTLTYRVDQILTVLPNQTDSLYPARGEDYVTLVTCTPIGINSHRLLVRGIRVPNARVHSAAGMDLHGQTPFAWWAVVAAGALVLVVVLTTPLGQPGPRGRAVE